MPQKTFDLLESILAGKVLSPEELDNLLHDKEVTEDQHLEFKHADILKNPKEVNAMVREYVSAFANCAGGVLIIGVDEKTRTITPCTTPGGGNLAEWASRALTPIAAFLNPPPRIITVGYTNGYVLVIAVDRSTGLVSINEAGSLVYYLRIHDQTLKAPAYLVSDLVLGRRQQPDLRITDCHLSGLHLSTHPTTHDGNIVFTLSITYENSSLVWAHSVQLGLVAIVQGSSLVQLPISSHLRSYVDVQVDAEPPAFQYKLANASGYTPEVNLDPFSAVTIAPFEVTIPHCVREYWYDYDWEVAVYLLAEGSQPVWYQLSLQVDQRLAMLRNSVTVVANDGDMLKLCRVAYGRVSVALRNMQRGLKPA
jgi:hypothetical protein